jgi:ABC-2 type transport system ATP-binding protein
MEHAIETFSLTKIFSDLWGRAKVFAVNDLNLQVRQNEVFGLLGPNGSGKTTTLKMLLGLLYPTKGRSLVLGGESTDPKISSRIGFLPEESYLYRYLNARETLDFYGRLFGLDSKVRKSRIEALLEMVGLKAVANRPVGTFSKGMARRIGLAQALINDPDLLILDEPTTGLDPIGTKQIKDLMLELAKRGKTILLCSHLLADVEDVCDRIAILYGGKIQCQGMVNELLEQTGKKQITTDHLSDKALDKIKQIAHSEQAECEITSPMDKLETFFIKTVASAQQQAQPTSGAVSTTQIGNFLSAETEPRPEALLDKLVTASMSAGTSDEQLGAEDVTTVTDGGLATSAPTTPEQLAQADEGLLSELSRETEPIETEAVSKDQDTQVPHEETQVPGQSGQSILDELTGKSDTQNQAPEETGQTPGEKRDA